MFDNFKVNTDSYKDIITQFQQIESFHDLLTDSYEINWNRLSSSIGPIDDRLRSYFETLKNSNGTINNAAASVEGLSAHLRQTGQAYDFTALKAAALNTAMNAGIMALAGLVVTGLTHAWDAINVTVAETQEKIDEITASLTELNSEYNSLVSRDTDSLSQSEKERLEYLEYRIAKEEELLKIQEAKKAEEEIGGGFTDYFDKDSYTRKLSDEKNFSLTNPLQSFLNITDLLKGGSASNIKVLSANTNNAIKKYESMAGIISDTEARLKTLPKDSYEYQVNQAELQSLKKQQDSSLSDMQEQFLTWKEKRLNYQAAIEDLNEKISNPDISESARTQAKDDLAEYESMLQAANAYIGQLDEILHSPQSMLESLDERLTRFSSEELQALFTEDELTILYNASFDANATENALRSIIADSQEQAEKDPIYMPLSFEARMLKVQDLSNDFDLFNKIYADVSDGCAFDWSSILNNEEFKEKCEELGSVYDDFIQTVSNAPNDIEACQSAFDNLAETYLANSDALRYVTADTKDATISMLEQMGVSNALEIVTNSLSLNEQALADSKSTVSLMAQTLAQSVTSAAQSKEIDRLETFNLQTATLEEINTLIAEADQLGINSGALVNFKLAKFDVSRQSLSLNEDVSGLLAMARAAGIATDATGELYSLQQQYNAAPTQAKASIAEKMTKVKPKVESEIENFKIPTVDYAPLSSKQPSSGTSNASTAVPTETKETFNFIETAITRIESAIDRVKSKAGETFRSFTSRSKAYSDAIAKITKEINIQEQAKQQYTANRDSIGLSEEWAAQVRDGSLNIAEIGDSSLKEQIRKYQEWNDKINECDKSIEDLKKEQRELVNENIELLITKYEKLTARTSNAVQRTQNRIDLKEALGGSAGIRSYISMNEGLSRQIGYIKEQNKELKEQQKNVPKCSEAWYEYQEQMDSNTASVQSLTKSMIENARAAASLAGEKADKNVEKYDSKDELYDAKIANATTAKKKNNLIDKKVKNMDNRQKEYDRAVVTSTDNLNSSASEIKRMKSKKTNTKNKTANAQNKTYNAVLKKVKAQIASGRKISSSLLDQAYQLNDNYELWNACVQYNEYFDAKEKNETIADLYKETSKQEKADLALEKFNNISAEYDNKFRSGEQKKTAANNRISLANAQGKQASASDYEELIDIEEKQQKILRNKRDALEKAFHDAVNNGSIKEGSEEWYEMLEAIQAVTDEIDESTQSLVEHQNALRQLEWDKFDDEMETFQRRNTNRDYQINMLSHKKLVDDETGEFTAEGNTTLNLRKSNYQDYLTQAAKYQQEYEKLQKQIAKGELSAEDENVITRLRELEDAHHDAMLSAEEEKDTIADLIKEGYQAQLNSLSELIQKYKDLRQNEKDAYEYQKSIAEKTKNIASLQKQLSAYGTNDTEEARAKLQQIKVDLENARQDLKETEYEKYLSDTNDMLDELYNDYEAFIDEKLIDTDDLLSNLDISINNMSADVITALNSIHASNETLLQALSSSDTNPSLSRASSGTPNIAVANPVTDGFGRSLISESANYTNPVNISIGDIILQDVQNPEQFSRQLIESIADNSRVQRTIQAVSVDRLAGGSALSAKQFK